MLNERIAISDTFKLIRHGIHTALIHLFNMPPCIQVGLEMLRVIGEVHVALLWQITQIWVIDAIFILPLLSSLYIQAKFGKEIFVLTWDIYSNMTWYCIDADVNDGHILIIYKKWHFLYLLPLCQSTAAYLIWIIIFSSSNIQISNPNCHHQSSVPNKRWNHMLS